MSQATATDHPRIGMLATVRNRRGVVSGVEPYDHPTEGRLHLVSIEYLDADGTPEDHLVWEREIGRQLLEPTALPELSDTAPMPPRDFDALVRATRWTALTPYTDPDGSGPLNKLPLVSPFRGAIQIEDFQLVPLLKALTMPRVSLMLADDVGLGKTIEAGLILSELILRRRVRRVLVVCPASLRGQWRQEMRQKFSLGFDEVDRDATHALRRRLGLDANPWRTFPRIVVSYDYLKQPDVLEEFRSASRVSPDSPHLPWDLLIVDEAHNLSPAAFGEDSEVSKMLGVLGPLFEHKLFLTATPHNGHTRSFSGLLEYLDPVRFSRTSDKLSDAERARVEEVVVRRLKREINDRTDPARFARRDLAALPLKLHPAERELGVAFERFRKKVHALIADARRGEQLAGAFAVEILGKRLLSCPVAFADSWYRYQQGLQQQETADVAEVRQAERAAREDTADDQEAESRRAHAARTVGAWLKPLAADLENESLDIERLLAQLGLTQGGTEVDPVADSRFDALCTWIDNNLRTSIGWRDDERLVVFTEYKTTLDYLDRRLRARYKDPGAIRVLFGGAEGEDNRQDVIAAFNNPADPVRVLVATDAASEGLNLQETARYLLHFDIPWNPMRLEQRNGRLDRHGQARDVVVHHFGTEEEADLRFLAYVVRKVETIREDLGSVGDVFDAAFQRRFIHGEAADAVQQDVERGVEAAKGRAEFPRDKTTGVLDETGQDEFERLKALASELDLDAGTLRDTLEIALGLRVGLPRFEPVGDGARVRLKAPIPSDWNTLINEALRLEAGTQQQGPLPALVFDPEFFIRTRNGRRVFRPQRDTALLHLGHPLFHRALATFARARFPGSDMTATRWTARRGEVPAGADALLLLTVEELAVNELRESFHHWVRTIQLPIVKGRLGSPLAHQPAVALRHGDERPDPLAAKRARELWSEIETEVARLVKNLRADLTRRLQQALDEERTVAFEREQERFKSRQGEVSQLIQSAVLGRLERELEELRLARQQGVLFDGEQRLDALLRSEQEKEEEVRRRKAHHEELARHLERERQRVIQYVLPRRYAMRGDAQVFPVAVEIRVPERS
jgi:hypothetical protein